MKRAPMKLQRASRAQAPRAKSEHGARRLRVRVRDVQVNVHGRHGRRHHSNQRRLAGRGPHRGTQRRRRPHRRAEGAVHRGAAERVPMGRSVHHPDGAVLATGARTSAAQGHAVEAVALDDDVARPRRRRRRRAGGPCRHGREQRGVQLRLLPRPGAGTGAAWGEGGRQCGARREASAVAPLLLQELKQRRWRRGGPRVQSVPLAGEEHRRRGGPSWCHHRAALGRAHRRVARAAPQAAAPGRRGRQALEAGLGARGEDAHHGRPLREDLSRRHRVGRTRPRHGAWRVEDSSCRRAGRYKPLRPMMRRSPKRVRRA
mmetsp:Transcript_57878/g.188165  ORF Transcript_57878/g.188165 Transcript_57878/m.188165 type:complete len:316 (+) Transcript_57878:1796-2743(+)